MFRRVARPKLCGYAGANVEMNVLFMVRPFVLVKSKTADVGVLKSGPH